MINGNTEIIAHIGYPTHTFKSPMIYNPYFQEAGINAVVVPMGCKSENYPAFLKTVFTLENIRGALITMPHKVTTVGLLDEVTATVRVAGACNAVKRLADGRLVGDMFDGAGFVRGVQRKGFVLTGKRVLVVGTGGVGCAIAASLAGAGIAATGAGPARSCSKRRSASGVFSAWPIGSGSSARRRCMPVRSRRRARCSAHASIIMKRATIIKWLRWSN